MEIAVLACGCFWGPEKKFGSLNGVYKTCLLYTSPSPRDS